MESTLTSLGDYDSCLRVGHSIQSEDGIQGKYCLTDLFPIQFSNRSSHLLSLEKLTYFKGFSFVYGVCVPSKCSPHDVRSLLSDLLREEYLMTPKGAITCDTSQSISLWNRIINLTKHQVISLTVVSSILGLVASATLYHVLCVIFAPQVIRSQKWVLCASAYENSKILFLSSNKESRLQILDAFKLSFIIFGTLAHFMACIEIPIGYFMLDRHRNLHEIFSKMHLQPLMNENGVVIFAYLGGFVTFTGLYPLAKDGKLPYAFVAFIRWVHFVPSILCLTMIEFIWPIFGSGPFFTRVADFVLKKCTESWWWNLFFIQNWFPVLKIVRFFYPLFLLKTA